MTMINIKTRPTPERMRGAIMPLVFVVCLICAIIGMGLLMLAFRAKMLGIRTGADIVARSAADAAVAQAVFQMNEKLKVKPWDDSYLPSSTNNILLNCDATFDYSVGKNAGIYTVQGTGRSGVSVRTVNGVLRLYSPFDYAIYARNTLELKSTTIVDWYNSEPDDWPLQVGTSSTSADAITLMSGTKINGDVVVGMGGDPESVINSKISVIITGDTYPMFSHPELPTITVPPSLASNPTQAPIKSTTTISASGKYSGIDLPNDANLTIAQPVTLYVTGTMKLGTNAVVSINNGASLVLYLAGNLVGNNSAGFNNATQNAKQLRIYCLDSCGTVDFKNSSSFYGAIYAPNASIDLKNGADVYGSIVGETFILRNSATFFYDASLRNLSVEDEAVRFVVCRWSEQ